VRIRQTPPITIFTPSFADEDNTNAQNLTVKEIVARLPPDLFRVIMISAGKPDVRIAARPNTDLVRWSEHWNSARLIKKIFLSKPDIYFFPRYGPLDRTFFALRRYLGLRTAIVSYVVMTMTDVAASKLAWQSIFRADRLCANSEYVAETIAQRFGVDAEVIYDGVDRRFFFARQETDGSDSSKDLVVLYAGSFQARKRVDLVIQSAVRWPNIQFRLAGQGETERLCRVLCQQHGCKNVTFLGHLSSDELGQEMRKADIFLFPSILEGHPQVLLQAAACGLPAIAMNHYRPSYVVNGKTGFLVESDQKLAECFDLLVTNPELQQSMSEAATRYSRNFDWDRIAVQWIDIFREVVEEKQRVWRPRIQHA
jgi:glycosyltransferase involved in cell wall biosynthesis